MEKLRFYHSLLGRIVVALILGLIIPITSPAQCDECSDNKVTLFDVRVNVDEPPSSDTKAYASWLSLFDLGAFARTISQEEDPTKGCFIWVDMGTRYKTPDDSSTYGVENITSAPAGPIKSTDYLLTGSVTPISDNLYLFTWQLECGTSREVVKTSSSVYTAGTGVPGRATAARQAAQGLQPLAQTITDFELDKRDQDVKVARDYESEIVMTPEKDNLQLNDSVRIEMELVDKCDDYPLEGREITLEAKGGTVSETKVTTDEDGKAWVTFISGSTPGVGRVSATYDCKKPHGYPFDILGTTRFNLPSNMWDVKGYWYQDVFSSSNVTSSEGGPTVRNTANAFFHAQGRFSFLYENKDPDNQGEDTLIVSAPDDTSAGTVESMMFFGTSQEMGVTRLETFDEDGNVIGYYYANSNASGVTGDESSPGLYFEKSGSLGFFQLGASQHRIGSYHIKLSGVPDDGPTPIDEWNSLAAIFFSSYDPGAKFRSMNNNFEVRYMYNKTTAEGGHSSTISIFVHALFFNNNSPTGIRNIVPMDLPQSVVLYQNYPNPFNPTTTITFGLPERSVVKLKIYNLLGKEVATLVNDESLPAGSYNRQWNAANIPNGIYFYRLQAGSFTETKKLVLLR